MAHYRICPDCGANLDPGEICDCKEKEAALLEQEQPQRKTNYPLSISVRSATVKTFERRRYSG